MVPAMAATKKTPTKKPEKAAPASKPTLAEIGREAQRVALLAELKAQGWNLTATARELGLNNASNVIRSIKSLGLDDEYEAARERGDVAPGRHA